MSDGMSYLVNLPELTCYFYNTSNLCKKRSFKGFFRRIILKPFFLCQYLGSINLSAKIIWG